MQASKARSSARRKGGSRSDWKKAVVRLAEGHDIDMTAPRAEDG